MSHKAQQPDPTPAEIKERAEIERAARGVKTNGNKKYPRDDHEPDAVEMPIVVPKFRHSGEASF